MTGNELNLLVAGQSAKVFTVADIDFMETANNPWPSQKKPPRGITVIGGGALTVVLLDDSDTPEEVTLPDPGATWTWVLQVQGIKAAGSTATQIVAVW